MTTARDWKPINYMGSIYYDPRHEIQARADNARKGNDSYVAVPLALALALADLTECDATATIKGDEDGPLPPVLTRCRRVRDHQHRHSNGYTSWE